MSRISLLRTTVFRLAMRYAGFVCLLTTLCFGIIYWVTIAQLQTQIDAGLRAELSALARLDTLKGPLGLQQTIAALSTTKSLGASDTGDAGPRQYLLVNRAFRPLAGSLSRWPSGMRGPGLTWATLSLREIHGEHGLDPVYGHFVMRAVAIDLPGDDHLLVGQSLNELIELRDTILALSIAAIIAVLATGITGGVLVGHGVARRLQAITHTADTIMAGDLSQRIPEEQRLDEFDALASKLNAMLDRIEQLMKSTREVTENVAHDLRGPLTRLRGRAEMALMRQDDPVRQNEALQQAVEETDRIVATLNAILSIAQIESGARREWIDTDMAAVCHDAAELYEVAAEAKGLAFRSDIAPVPAVRGNRQLLAQAVGNLLDNAIKYTPTGGTVSLSTRLEDGHVVVRIEDTGPGIPEGMHDKVLERFVRLDASRGSPGNGLGLALVKAVADQHGARLSLGDHEPGLRASLSFRIG